MGFRVTIGSQGVVTEDLGNNSSNQLIVPDIAGANKPVFANANGTISSSFQAQTVRYEFHDHSGTFLVPTASYSQFWCNGQNDQVDGKLYCWLTGTSVFKPESVGSVYTIRLSGKIANPSRNGVVHIDFALSGATPPNYVQGYNRHKQGREFSVSNQADHVDVAMTVPVFVDQNLFVSGAIFWMTTTANAGLTMTSASIMIKEG